ncbi:type II toxin-antitoxin system VapC family toxin [Sulfurisphaera javensis]|uniref:Type II toxin-antitoxin system VapC family toxin n=1 Tax=Sulfurisphaera javensis TaxID=2049879 RepID=A0AAT9GV84_9CREN
MKDEYLLDTSALYPLLFKILTHEVNIDFISSSHILDLTIYELGNAIWKDAKLLKRIKDPLSVMRNFMIIISKMKTEKVTDYVEVMLIAMERDLTFYDSAYVYVAESKGYTLITYDSELLNKCKNAKRLEDILNKQS